MKMTRPTSASIGGLGHRSRSVPPAAGWRAHAQDIQIKATN